MERDANYVAVGAFMLLLLAMAVWFVLWYSGSSDRREYVRYEIYFTGSVSGLDQGSPVRYLGVDVGRVQRLSIDPKQPGRVKTVVDVDQAAPISSATRASLNMQGLTGLLFINLKQANSANAASGSAQNGLAHNGLAQGDAYPVIESEASDFDTLLASLPELMGRASQVFSDENVNALSNTLASLEAMTKGLPKTAEDIGKLVTEVRHTVREVDTTIASVRSVVDESSPEIKAAMARLNTVSDNLASASARVDRFVANSEVQLSHLSNQGLFELERLLRDVRVAANEFRDLSRSLKQNPAQLMYEPRVSGTEIPR